MQLTKIKKKLLSICYVKTILNKFERVFVYNVFSRVLLIFNICVFLIDNLSINRLAYYQRSLGNYTFFRTVCFDFPNLNCLVTEHVWQKVIINWVFSFGSELNKIMEPNPTYLYYVLFVLI